MKLADVKGDVGVAEPEQKDKTQQPKMYLAMLHNDDYSEAFFVAEMLRKHFNKDGAAAMSIMMDAHRLGKAPIGLYTKDVAETKAQAAMDEAQAQEYPLLISVEEAD